MELNPKQAENVLANFLSSWSIDRISEMNIEEYADLNDHDSLCYWLEYGTKELGAIGGISLNKFELWKPKGFDKELKDDRFRKENGYFWNARMGDNLVDAFVQIKKLIIQIVTYSQKGDWKAIDKIRFHAIGKWKLAFLFSNKKLLPVYSERALINITSGLGYDFTENTDTSILQEKILENKPAGENIFDFAHRLYSQFAKKKKNKANFFLIGSNYSNRSVMDIFLKHNCVAMGWLDWVDINDLMGASLQKINNYVYEHWENETPAVHKIQGYFRLFTQIKAGDIIAVKSQGLNKVKIIAYALVIERNGSIYFHDENILGHHINVEFLEVGLSKEIKANYATTIHQINPFKDGNIFNDIFGWYAESDAQVNSFEDETSGDDSVIIENEGEEQPASGYNPKIEDSFERGPMAGVIVRRIHNRIQNRFLTYLETTYPDDIRSGEKKYIDAMRVSGNNVYIYEIKPFSSAYSCIRQGIGQLLDYLHQDKQKKEKHILIVGPSIPDERDLAFINQVRQFLNVPFSYLSFNEADLTAQEF